MGAAQSVDVAPFSHVLTRLVSAGETGGWTELVLWGKEGNLVIGRAPVRWVARSFWSVPREKPNIDLQGYRALIAQHCRLIDGGQRDIPL